MSFSGIAAQLPLPSPGPSWWTVIATLAAVIAAGTALVTVIYSRRTVVDGRAAHRELMEAQGKASYDSAIGSAAEHVYSLMQTGPTPGTLTD